jgi:hypothetical protein
MWLEEFVAAMERHIGPRQADKYRHEYEDDARRMWRKGLSILEAVTAELIGPDLAV